MLPGGVELSSVLCVGSSASLAFSSVLEYMQVKPTEETIMHYSNDTQRGPAQEPITITDQNVGDWICARAPLQLEIPPGYFEKVKRQLQGMADDGRLTREDLAKITQEAIIERERRSASDFIDTL